jgi:ATP-binding cassette subfamily B protein
MVDTATPTATVDESTRSVDRNNDTGEIVNRLVDYMVGAGPGRFWLGVVIRLVSVAGLVAVPFFIGRAINVISEGGSTDELLNNVLLAGAALVIYVVLGIVAERIFSRLATYGTYGLQTAVFTNMQRLSLTFFDRQPIGELMSRVTNDTEATALFYENVVGQTIRALMTIAFVIVMMFAMSWELTLAALVVIPVMLGLTGLVEKIATPAFTRMQEQLGELSGFQEETISGHKVLISNRRQEWAGDGNEELASGVFDTGSKAFFAALLQIPITMSVTNFQVVIVTFVGALLAVEGQIGVGIIIAFLGYVALLAGPLSEIANLTSTTLNAVAGGRRVFTIIDEEPVVKDAPDANEYEFRGGHVEFVDVDFSYIPGRKILRHNTFEAQPGQKIGIVGPTGAGKSTIINILTRYYDLDSGSILIDGQDLKTLTQASLREQIGVVLQEPFLFSDTVMSNLKYARKGATDEECIEAAKEANAHEFILQLGQGYDTVLTERGSNLSAGQRQMITIARAMVARPKMLVLDEATSNVDTRTEKLVNEGLRRLMEGRTSFVIAHRLATVRDAAKILVLDAGVIVEQGSHDDLMAAKGFYYNLYMSQFRGRAPVGADTSDTSLT